MKYVQLILSKIIKIVASKCQILRLKCTKFYFGWGSGPDPIGGAYSAPPDLLAGSEGFTSKEGRRRGEGKVRRGKERERREGWKTGGEGKRGEEKRGELRPFWSCRQGGFLLQVRPLNSPDFSSVLSIVDVPGA